MKIFPIAIVLLLIFSEMFSFASQSVKARQGVIDLSEWDFSEDGDAKLNGEWEFYQSEFISPKGEIKSKKDYHNIPFPWSLSGEKLPYSTYASYRLKVFISNKRESLHLRVRHLFVPYKLFFNDSLVFQQGVPGKNKEQSSPGFNTGYISLPIDFHPASENGKRFFWLTFHVSNFSHAHAGFMNNIYLGRSESILRTWQLEMLSEIFIAGIILVFALYHLALFFLFRRKLVNLIFAILLIFVFFFVLVTNNKLLVVIFPNMSFELFYKIAYLASNGLPIFYLPFLRILFPKEIHKTLYKLFMGFVLAVIAIVLVSKPHFFTGSIKDYFSILQLVIFTYLVGYTLPAAVKRKRQGALLMMIGAVPTFLTGINDILYSHNLINSYYLSGYGVTYFVFVKVYVLARRFSKAFLKVEMLSEELSELNQSLEKKVEIRTQEIISQAKKIEEQSRKLEHTNKELLLLNDFKNTVFGMVIHDLKNPLNVILGMMELPYTKRTCSLIRVAALNMLNLVENLLDVQRLKETKLKVNKEIVDISQIVNNAFEQVFYMSKLNNTKLYDQSYPQEAYADPYVIERVLVNLLTNAIKYCDRKEGKVTLRVEETGHPNFFKVLVEDNGNGIPEGEKDGIFDRFVQVNPQRMKNFSSSGLGLTFCKMAIKTHKGDIGFSSGLGKGTTFWFTLPKSKVE